MASSGNHPDQADAVVYDERASGDGGQGVDNQSVNTNPAEDKDSAQDIKYADRYAAVDNVHLKPSPNIRMEGDIELTSLGRPKYLVQGGAESAEDRVPYHGFDGGLGTRNNIFNVQSKVIVRQHNWEAFELQPQRESNAAPDERLPAAVNGPLEILCLLDYESSLTHPAKWPAAKRWLIVSIYCLLQMFVLLTSTTYVSAEWLIREQLGGSTQVVTMGQSLFIAGNAIGPVFLGPMSDFIGRKWIYVVSIAAFAILNLGCAYAHNVATLIVFMFLTGAAGSTALCLVAATITDLFGDGAIAGQAMGLYVVSANCGPSLGSPVGGWIADNSNLGFKWIFLINVIFGLVFAVGMCFVPETLPRIVMLEAAKKDATKINEEQLTLLQSKVDLWSEFKFVTTMTFTLMFTEPIIICFGLFNGFAYGIMFLYLDGVYDVFAVNNGLTPIQADLTYLNFVVGVLLMFAFIPVQTRCYNKRRTPEARFYTSLFLVPLFPASLFWFAYTSDGETTYWSPIIAGTILGFADPLLWLGMLNYITDSYPNVAGSAIAAFLLPSFLIAGALCHVGVILFDKMSTSEAMAIVAYCSIGLCMLVYAIYYGGRHIRNASRLAKNSPPHRVF